VGMKIGVFGHEVGIKWVYLGISRWVYLGISF